MQDQNKSEKRKHPRMEATFVVSYRIKKPSEFFDLSQTRNISQGGLLITTNKKFDPGVVLEMAIRFPFVSERFKLTGQVVESKEKVRDLIYETHIQFKDSDEKMLREIGSFIEEKIKDA